MSSTGRPDPARSSGEARPADVARRALWAARRGQVGNDEVDSEDDHSATPEARPATRGTDQAASEATAARRQTQRTAQGPRPGDVARDALRGAGGPRTVRTEDEAASEPVPVADRPDDGVGSGAPRPGDVAREALRAARTGAGRSRTAFGAKGVDGPSRPVAAKPKPSASAPSPSTADRRAAPPRSPVHSATTPEAAPPPTERRFPPGPAPAVGPVGRDARTRPTGPAPDADGPPPRSLSAPGGAPQPHTTPPASAGDLRRTFPALPRQSPGGGRFAETWWGDAWVRALEEAALDPARLARGRVYAGEGHVDAVTVTPGLVLAYVHGSRPRPYRVQIRMRTLTDEDWERFLDAAAERPGHIAALLDKDMPQSLAECGVELLPGPGDLEPHCSCPDFGHPCKHAAALCYQTARLLDEDPFVLLLLRGRGERELLDALSRRNAALAARSAHAGQKGGQEPELPGVRARDALAPRQLPPLPQPLPPPAHPEQPPVYPASPGGPDPMALDQLATDAATRAHALLTTGRDPVAELTLWQDAVRLAATRPGSGLTATTRALYASLASAAGRTPADLARAVAAWRQGGLEGLAVLEETWDPPAGRFDRARPLLLAADFPAFRPWHNHLTHPRGHIQLRLGHDGLWYAYESEPGHDDWWPRGTPDLDPVGALTGLGTPDAP
ncbi:SWIM zinc finger family protein [Streptomyces flaveus]|uniref:SWIM zinc finger family protein n=1 Tax=Streptomyces flaveus TaxID=66370 RepID=UPI0016712CDB|nr:SWIM zinc finger family protein [Streptomyces flaveus]